MEIFDKHHFFLARLEGAAQHRSDIEWDYYFAENL